MHIYTYIYRCRSCVYIHIGAGAVVRGYNAHCWSRQPESMSTYVGEGWKKDVC